MSDFITEKENSWDFLRRTELPVFLYGMGDGADKILRVFDMYSIPLAGVFASDEFVRGHSFKGHLVHSLSQVESVTDDFVVVLAFGAGYKELYDRIMDISSRHILLAPDVPVAGEGLFTREYCAEHADEIEKVYDLLADGTSRKVYADIINGRISGKVSYLDRCTTPKSEAYENILRPGEDEEYLDLGAYNGDTVREFSSFTGGKYRRIFALEPDGRNFRKLSECAAGMENVHAFNAAAWDSDGEIIFNSRSGRSASVSKAGKPCPALRGDSVTDSATYIKMDVEGAERQAIDGCAENIRRGCRLNVALYHRTEDIFAIPLQIHEINPSLKLYIRHHMYIPAWDTLLYAAP